MPRKSSMSKEAWERHKQRERDRGNRMSLHRDIKIAINTTMRAEERTGIDIAALIRGIGRNPGAGYHLDHIIPLSNFDPEDIGHIRAAWSIENLRWVPASFNTGRRNVHCRKETLEYFDKHGITPGEDMINSQRKGSGWEAKVRERMIAIYGEGNVHRGFQFVKNHKAPDCVTPELCIEAKARKKLNPLDALEQCESDADGLNLSMGRYCVIYVKIDRKRPYVAMRMEDFEDLIRTRRELQNK